MLSTLLWEMYTGVLGKKIIFKNVFEYFKIEFRERGRAREREKRGGERNIDRLPHAPPLLGWSLTPGRVSCLGTELAPSWYMG